MRNHHWSVYCAVIYFSLVFIINLVFSTWSNLEYGRLTQEVDSLGQAAPSITQGFDSLFESLENTTEDNDPNVIQINAEEILEKSAQLVKTAKSAFVYMLVSTFAGVFTTIALIFPKIVMDIIEKFIEIPDIDYDSLALFKSIMVLANISIACWDIYGLVNIWKYF
ncbi:hypothetical protein HP548_12215 [Paenibacillus taichungensis]|uniref:Uncharacterized protein n=1 Tax=Paenibacillus taichungensis TaxID=484184 RepID=A0ABX2MLD5_9BACL|nr:hypothetical protein [Paenibacillus taichungensis]NUU54842.1 hypothetical protein [Paenibacillus taichungensis]